MWTLGGRFWTGKVAARWRHGSGHKSDWHIWVKRETVIFCVGSANARNDKRNHVIARYVAPEYAQSGQITEKADVYSFGVVLVELVTGRKAMEINRPKGQQCLTEWV